MNTIENLFIKTKRGNSPLTEVSCMEVSEKGIIGGVPSLPSRQVLILPSNVLNKFNLLPGQLRENIIVKGFDIHTLLSGTVIKIGEVKIRLTYHCEPCARIEDFVKLRKIVHQRGYLGSFLNKGVIKIGDNISILEKDFESIPYDIKERIKWYLNKHQKPVSVKDLAYEIGLSQSYYRAIPNMLKLMDSKYQSLVYYQTKKEAKQLTLFEQ